MLKDSGEHVFAHLEEPHKRQPANSAQGYNSTWQQHQRKSSGGTPSPGARQLAWLLVRDRKKLNDAEEAELVRLLQDDEVAQSYGLAQQFQQMVRQRQIEHLDPWLERCRSEGASELQSFAAGLRQEGASIRAALSLPYSNGPVEGQITRLKLLKRQMYGRAKLDLLRLRVVHRR